MLYPIVTILSYSLVPVINFVCDLKLLYAANVFEYKKSSLRILNCCLLDNATSVQEGRIIDAQHRHPTL
jgi:hypothetical protein